MRASGTGSADARSVAGKPSARRAAADGSGPRASSPSAARHELGAAATIASRAAESSASASSRSTPSIAGPSTPEQMLTNASPAKNQPLRRGAGKDSTLTAMTGIAAVVLAAGKGTRMGSDRAKVLHELSGRPLVAYPIAAAAAAGAERVVVVVGHDKDAVIDAVVAVHGGLAPRFAEQTEQLGTGHAVLCALPELDGFEGDVLVLSGDVPLVTAQTLGALAAACRDSEAGLSAASFRPPDKTGYGRMVRGADGGLVAIVEERDADPQQRAIDECNAGMYCVAAEHLRGDLPRIGRGNAQNEYYLTDLVALAAKRGRVGSVELSLREASGVNTPAQLAELERELSLPPPAGASTA